MGVDLPTHSLSRIQENGKSTRDLIKRDLKVVWHPCTQMKDHEKIPLNKSRTLRI